MNKEDNEEDDLKLPAPKIRKIVVRSLKKAGKDFEINGLGTSDYAVRLLEHFILGIEHRQIEYFAGQKAQELGSVLFSIGMRVSPEQFGDAAKASTEFRSQDSMKGMQSMKDNSRIMDALKLLRRAEELLELPKDFYVRRRKAWDTSDFSYRGAIQEGMEQGNGDQDVKPPSVRDQRGDNSYRPPEIEDQRIDPYTVAVNPAQTLWMLVEAADDQDILDMRSSYASSRGPDSVGAEAARQLLDELDRDQNFISGEAPYHSPWAAISGLLSLVGGSYMSAEQVRQACGHST